MRRYVSTWQWGVGGDGISPDHDHGRGLDPRARGAALKAEATRLCAVALEVLESGRRLGASGAHRRHKAREAQAAEAAWKRRRTSSSSSSSSSAAAAAAVAGMDEAPSKVWLGTIHRAKGKVRLS